MKRGGAFVPAWRNIPKSHSSSILEVESASSIGSWTNGPHTMGNGKVHFVGLVMQGKMYRVVLCFLDVYVHREIIRKGRSNFKEHNSFIRKNYKIYQRGLQKTCWNIPLILLLWHVFLCSDLNDKIKLFIPILSYNSIFCHQKNLPKHSS